MLEHGFQAGAVRIQDYDAAAMLPRPSLAPTLPHVPRQGACRRRRQSIGAPWPSHPVDPAFTRWLKAPGSLTARLRLLGQVKVQVLAQGTRRLWPAERRALGLVSGHVREVVLSIDGAPVVWARSATSHRALKGPWRALKGLGTRPLAELLFSAHAAVVRGRLGRHEWRRRGPEHGRARRQWPGIARVSPGWARASVFTRHQQPLRVMEAFSPWAARLPTY